MVRTTVGVAVGYLQPILVVDDPDDQVRRSVHDDRRVCVFQIDDPYRDFIAEAFQPLASLTGASAGSPFTITQTARWMDANGLPAGDAQIGRISRSPEAWLDNELMAAALGLAGLAPECHSERPMSLAYTVGFQFLDRASRIAPDDIVAAGYASRLHEDSMLDPDAWSRLSTLTDQEFTDWFGQHRATIAECALIGDELP